MSRIVGPLTGRNQLLALAGHLKGLREFKLRSDIHLARRLYHMVGISLMPIVYHNLGRETSLWILTACIVLIVPLDALRVRVPYLNNIAQRVFGVFLRQNEITNISGFSYLLIGAFLLVFLYSEHVVKLTLITLAFADPIASIIGIHFGKKRWLGSKTILGSLAATIVAAVIAFIYLSEHTIIPNTPTLYGVCIVSGIAASLSEALGTETIDDNFTFPVLYGSFLSILFFGFGL